MERDPKTIPEEILDKIRQSPSRRGATEQAWRANFRYGDTTENRRAIQNAASERKHADSSHNGLDTVDADK